MGKLKLSLEDFFELTPVEFKKILKAYNQEKTEHFELTQLAVYMGFGQANSGKKFKSVFKQQKKQPVSKKITPEQKQKDLEDIQKRLEGR